jgi:hypothetical protein
MQQTRLLQHEDLPLFTVPETPEPPPVFPVPGKEYTYNRHTVRYVGTEPGFYWTKYVFEIVADSWLVGGQYKLSLRTVEREVEEA